MFPPMKTRSCFVHAEKEFALPKTIIALFNGTRFFIILGYSILCFPNATCYVEIQ